jgi:predicted DCC family thiol-disulfide oxidoreductase YuxK
LGVFTTIYLVKNLPRDATDAQVLFVAGKVDCGDGSLMLSHLALAGENAMLGHAMLIRERAEEWLHMATRWAVPDALVHHVYHRLASKHDLGWPTQQKLIPPATHPSSRPTSS